MPSDRRRAAATPPAEATPSGAWREAFLRAPYLRDALVAMGVLAETFETACTWDRFAGVPRERASSGRATALRERLRRRRVTCRFTHVYPDGPGAVLHACSRRRGGEPSSSSGPRSRRAAADAVIAAGGTITHHHAVGRDHRPWYDRQRPEPFAAALRAAKRALDPAGILNPGVLIDAG